MELLAIFLIAILFKQPIVSIVDAFASVITDTLKPTPTK